MLQNPKGPLFGQRGAGGYAAGTELVLSSGTAWEQAPKSLGDSSRVGCLHTSGQQGPGLPFSLLHGA